MYEIRSLEVNSLCAGLLFKLRIPSCFCYLKTHLLSLPFNWAHCAQDEDNVPNELTSSQVPKIYTSSSWPGLLRLWGCRSPKHLFTKSTMATFQRWSGLNNQHVLSYIPGPGSLSSKCEQTYHILCPLFLAWGRGVRRSLPFVFTCPYLWPIYCSPLLIETSFILD